MRNKLIVVLIFAVTIVAGISSYMGRDWAARAMEKGPFVTEIIAVPLSLSREDKSLASVGELAFVAGWALASESEDFGGWSAMVLGKDAKSLVALNDKGDWLEAELTLEADRPLAGGLLYPFEQGARWATKSDYDAESLVRIGDGYLVGMEQDHRILAVDGVGGANRLSAHNDLVDLSVLSSNGGLEAITVLPSGKLMLFAERGLDQKATLPVWIVGEKHADIRRFMPPKNYSPTDAATLPNGDILLLVRHYSQLDGVSVKILHLTAEEIGGGETLVGTELAHLADPLSVDNMEALDIEVLEDGRVRLYMMSDDNFNPLQRTLLMIFDWQRTN